MFATIGIDPSLTGCGVAILFWEESSLEIWGSVLVSDVKKTFRERAKDISKSICEKIINLQVDQVCIEYPELTGNMGPMLYLLYCEIVSNLQRLDLSFIACMPIQLKSFAFMRKVKKVEAKKLAQREICRILNINRINHNLAEAILLGFLARCTYVKDFDCKFFDEKQIRVIKRLLERVTEEQHEYFHKGKSFAEGFEGDREINWRNSLKCGREKYPRDFFWFLGDRQVDWNWWIPKR